MPTPISASILIVDDDAAIVTSAQLALKPFFTTIYTERFASNLYATLNARTYDTILLDMNLRKGLNDGGEGLFWLQEIKRVQPDAQVILMTAFGEISLAVEAMKRGAFDFLLKPWDNERLVHTLVAAVKSRQLQQKEQTKQAKTLTTNLITGESEAMKRALDLAAKVAPTDVNVLILGENGTGKGVLAQEIHARSSRAKQPFVTVDLGAVHETLFESELFGHEKGAFTDAKTAKPGRFELAHGGTLFMDEIGNLSPSNQAKLLTVIQHQSFTKLGSNTSQTIDFRLITATNSNLNALVTQKVFRQDLMYRINTVEIRLPAMRERPEDIPHLVDHFLLLYGNKYNRLDIGISALEVKKLQGYHWPGNIRELQHAIERAIILSDSNELKATTILGEHQSWDANTPALTFSTHSNEATTIKDLEKDAILKALEKHAGNISHSAKELGLTRASFYRRLQKYGIEV